MAARVIAYRSSWMPQDQRRIERDMFAGVPAGIFTTSPLKLGIEVNALDASVGLFYYILLLHRQSGRASYAYQ
jgi:DEAD/DEAH box helicase domain-containing protein